MKPTSLAAEEGRAGTLNALRRRLAIGAGAATLLAIAAGMAHAQIPDHLKCYKIKDPVKLSGTLDLATPQFGIEPGCTVGAAKYFCAPAVKSNVAVIDKATKLPITPLPVTGPDPGDRICYKLKCPVPPPPFPPDQNVTDQFGNRTLTKFKAAFMCTPAFKGSARFVDNMDGTVTDNYTGLQWEKKDGAGGGPDLSNAHDVDNPYAWSASGSDPDGTAFIDFLGELNGCESSDGITVTGGFADHCDWRLPTIAELQTIVDLSAPGCGSGSPCIDATVFGPTAASWYWSSTTIADSPALAWFVDFSSGSVFNFFKGFTRYGRAVRGGS